MADTKNLCAQIPLTLHDRVCTEKDQAGLTTAQYITNLLTGYYQMKENGGNMNISASRRAPMGTVSSDCRKRWGWMMKPSMSWTATWILRNTVRTAWKTTAWQKQSSACCAAWTRPFRSRRRDSKCFSRLCGRCVVCLPLPKKKGRKTNGCKRKNRGIPAY